MTAIGTNQISSVEPIVGHASHSSASACVDGRDESEHADSLSSSHSADDGASDIYSKQSLAGVRTRSSHGISKKRILKDAADDESHFDVPVTLPKKIRINNNATLTLVQGYTSENASDSDTLSQSGSPSSISMSPLKLGGSDADGRDFETEPVLNDGLFLNVSKSDGKRKAEDVILKSVEDIEHASLSNYPNNEDEEMAKLRLALAQSKQSFQQLMNPASDASAGVASTSSILSSAIVSAANPASDLKSVEVPFVNKQEEERPETITSNPTPVAVVANGGRVRRSFKDVVTVTTSSTPMMSNGPLLMDDLMRYHVRSLPATCQVTLSKLHDPLLANDYASLPPLSKNGSLVSWSTADASSNAMNLLVAFSQWATQCPDMDFDLACSAVRFSRYKNFINPCRVSPLDVNILYTQQDHRRSILQCNYKTAVCLTPILTKDSYLTSPATFGLRNKFISGHFHQQEWQHFQAFTTMVFDKQSMVAQIYKGAMSFTTMGSTKTERDPSSSKTPRNPNIFSSMSNSSTTLSKKVVPNSTFKTVLDYSDDVPIHDARVHPFNFESDLDDIDAVLPRFGEEIPPHSFVVVAYTMNHYEKDGRAHLATNILFVILIGID